MKSARGKGERRLARNARRAWAMLAALAVSLALGTEGAIAAAPEQQILLQADEITYDTSAGIISARGNVQISSGTRTLMADEVTYDENADRVSATGHVSIQDQTGNVAFADHVELTQDLREGALKGLAALIGETGRLAASSGERREGRFTIAHGAVFTPCAICEEEEEPTPLWQVRAARIIHDQLQRRFFFRDATFEFMGVPVLYLPFFSEADPTVKHQSGFLLPEIGSSSTLGTFAKIPYYISLSPSRDVTLSPLFTGAAGNALQTEYRQRFDEGGFWLQGNIGYDPNAPGMPGRSLWFSSLFGSGRMPLTQDWHGGFDVQLASNDTFLQRYEISYVDRLTTDLFAERVTGRNRLAFTGFFFQSLRTSDVTGEIPLALPLVEYTYIPEDSIGGGRLRVDSSALMLTRDIGTDMLRGSVAADWRRPFVSGDGQLFTFEAIARGDLYYIDDATFSAPSAEHNTETIGRSLGLAMVEWRWPFAREMGFGNSTLVLEPIVQLVGASVGGNPAGLPNEDSTSIEFDVTNLFSPNQSPGLDLWTGGPRSNAGVRATALFPQGSVEATLGEDFRFVPDPNLPPSIGVGGDRSDIVGQFKINLPPNLSLTHQFNFDPSDGGSLRRNEVYLTAHFGRSTLNLSYLKLPETVADPTLGEQEQVNLDTTLSIYGNWAVFASMRRDIAKSQMLESSIGIRYEDECFIAAFGFHRRDTATLNLRPASSVLFRIGLKTGLTSG